MEIIPLLRWQKHEKPSFTKNISFSETTIIFQLPITKLVELKCNKMLVHHKFEQNQNTKKCLKQQALSRLISRFNLSSTNKTLRNNSSTFLTQEASRES